LHGALTPLVHLQAKEALNSQFRQRTQVTREDVGLKRLDTPALAEGAGLWGDVPWRLATGNERLTGLLVGNRIDHLWVCGGKWESYGGGKGWWGWEADIPLATAEGRAPGMLVGTFQRTPWPHSPPSPRWEPAFKECCIPRTLSHSVSCGCWTTQRLPKREGCKLSLEKFALSTG
jgi:hypothetical protein